MIALTSLRSCNDESRRGADHEMESYLIEDGIDDFSGAGNLLDDIDFDDLFVGMDYGDVLPDLEIDPEMLAEFSVSGGEESSDQLNLSSLSNADEKLIVDEINKNGSRSKQEEERGSGSGSGSCLSREDETVSKRDEDHESNTVDNQISSQNNKESSNRSRKSGTPHNKGSSQGKRKVKVDWTPELHRRFVQAVEQLGMDKAVPSRILEIMGIDCLTRHNIASHLQKYRSHQKHLLAREAEAASWSQRRQIYGGGAAARGSNKRPDHLNPWIAPTMGFPPPAANLLHPPYWPLHVWGHPTVDPSSAMHHVWPKHLLHHSPSPPPHGWPPPPPPPPPHGWPPPPPPPSDRSSYWHPNHHQRVPNALTPGTPCFPPQVLATKRIPSSSSSSSVVPGIPPAPPHAMYKIDHGIGVRPPGAGLSDSHHPLPFDLHPTKERIDAAIGDVLLKPWLPLPLGLKPPSLDSVMVELQRQGIPKIPPSSTTTTTTTNTSTSTAA